MPDREEKGKGKERNVDSDAPLEQGRRLAKTGLARFICLYSLLVQTTTIFATYSTASNTNFVKTQQKSPVVASDKYQTLTVICKGCSYYQSKCSKCRPSVLTQARSRQRHCSLPRQ